MTLQDQLWIIGGAVVLAIFSLNYSISKVVSALDRIESRLEHVRKLSSLATLGDIYHSVEHISESLTRPEQREAEDRWQAEAAERARQAREERRRESGATHPPGDPSDPSP